jgi:hypothetical protein
MTEPHRTADSTPTAADALAIIEQSQSHATSRLTPNAAVFYGLWGVIWVVIGLIWYLARLGSVDAAVAAWTTGAVIVVGLLVSAVVGIRSARGVSGPSTRQGLWYGLSWPISMSLLGVLVGGLGSLGVDGDLMAILSPALFVFVAGALYVGSGAIWTSVVDYVLGIWVMVVAVVSVLVGLPASPLVIGLGGGGGLLVVAVRTLLRGRAR